MPDTHEFDYRPEHFQEVRKRLYALAGIKLSDTKDSMVYSRLARRLRALNLDSFTQYLQYLDHNLAAEQQDFINALTTNLTSFFREPHHFEFLAKYLQRHPGERTIWCAAASTGEEPYSIAMVVAEHFARFDTPVRIIASDIDSQVLAKAKQAVYPIDRLESVSEARVKHFFWRGKGKMQGQAKVVPELTKMIEFKTINLLSDWSLKSDIDLIFCRNVMIYFDRPTQLGLLERMAKVAKPNSYYVAGHSENLAAARHLMLPVGKTIYRFQ